jgi:hypothetical protein
MRGEPGDGFLSKNNMALVREADVERSIDGFFGTLRLGG